MKHKETYGETPVPENLQFNPITGRPYHPDRAWLPKISGFHPCGDGWVICGTLSFRMKHLHTQNEKVKSFFGALNWHLNGEFNWKNVPVYWRWEYDSKERIHCHFALMDATPEFHYLRGSENTFADKFELTAWLKSNWTHGVSHYRAYEDEGWLNYLTKDNPLLQSCYSPPIHYLKRKHLEVRSLEASK